MIPPARSAGTRHQAHAHSRITQAIQQGRGRGHGWQPAPRRRARTPPLGGDAWGAPHSSLPPPASTVIQQHQEQQLLAGDVPASARCAPTRNHHHARRPPPACGMLSPIRVTSDGPGAEIVATAASATADGASRGQVRELPGPPSPTTPVAMKKLRRGKYPAPRGRRSQAVAGQELAYCISTISSRETRGVRRASGDQRSAASRRHGDQTGHGTPAPEQAEPSRERQ